MDTEINRYVRVLKAQENFLWILKVLEIHFAFLNGHNWCESEYAFVLTLCENYLIVLEFDRFKGLFMFYQYVVKAVLFFVITLQATCCHHQYIFSIIGECLDYINKIQSLFKSNLLQ